MAPRVARPAAEAGRRPARLSLGGEAQSGLLNRKSEVGDIVNCRDFSLCAAGHGARGGGNIKVVEGKAKYILKLLDERELEIYQFLFPDPHNGVDPICAHVPNFAGVVNHDSKKYMRLRNVLAGYRSPKVMDIKIGIRTFVETECENPKLRPDLFRRLSEEYPDEVTDAERKAGAITKHRWMTVRDRCSTIGTLGFRIDGIAGYTKTDRKTIEKELGVLRTMEDVTEILGTFCEAAATAEGEADGEGEARCSTADIAVGLLTGIHDLFRAMQKSLLVATHEFIGTSVLLVADDQGQVEVNWIDFAKTLPVPDELVVTHERPWVMGNHEDGLFIGMQNLMRPFLAIAANRTSLRRSLRASIKQLLPPAKRRSVGGAEGAAGLPSNLEGSSAEPDQDADVIILQSLPCYQNSILDSERVQASEVEAPAPGEAQADVADTSHQSRSLLSRFGSLLGGMLSWRPWRRRRKWDSFNAAEQPPLPAAALPPPEKPTKPTWPAAGGLLPPHTEQEGRIAPPQATNSGGISTRHLKEDSDERKQDGRSDKIKQVGHINTVALGATAESHSVFSL